jgi:hypothetical protein
MRRVQGCFAWKAILQPTDVAPIAYGCNFALHEQTNSS